MFELFKKNKMIKIIAPMTGEVVDISEVPDEVFSKKMVGDGIAIIPSNGMVTSPCNGKIVHIFPTNHALGIITEEGIEILIHIGIDTVELKGKGFKKLVNVGDKVKIGQPLMEVDLNFIKESFKEIISPIVITNKEMVKKLTKMKGQVIAGKDATMGIEKYNK